MKSHQLEFYRVVVHKLGRRGGQGSQGCFRESLRPYHHQDDVVLENLLVVDDAVPPDHGVVCRLGTTTRPVPNVDNIVVELDKLLEIVDQLLHMFPEP